MPEVPLCPDCKNRMVARYVCQHCGFDSNVPRTPQQILEKPFNCVKCGKPTAKKVDGIPVCGECFIEGWGRFPNMPLTVGLTQPTKDPFAEIEKRDKIVIPFKCPNCNFKFKTKQRLDKHITKIHGGKGQW